jgi:uncharacterized protein (DUF362 family)
MKTNLDSNFDPRLALAEGPASYEERDGADLSNAIDRLASQLDWSEPGKGPFGALIKPGARVLIKPNFVLDHNQGTGGMEPMITHPSVVKAVVHGVLRAEPSSVMVGDAPIQSCDFAKLLEFCELDSWSENLTQTDQRFKGIKDLRRTVCKYVNGIRVAEENVLPEEEFVLFDLQRESLLEPITDGSEAFRVTCYDPRLMAKTHAPGTHRYLVARDVIEADVVINLPKLKTHKKAGVTCALKNLIGINGNKEYLPHHRLGGSDLGGDCYPGRSRLKRVLEFATDQQNFTSSPVAGRVWSGFASQLNRALQVMGDSLGIEGSWSGNDTIWRTGLDLNRIILYGETNGRLMDTPQRLVVHLVDAMVAGQGDGPLAPQPLQLGLLIAGNNAAYVDWLGAQLLGYDPYRIPIAREAFGKFKWPITHYRPEDGTVSGDWGAGYINEVVARKRVPVIHPFGWRDAVATQG